MEFNMELYHFRNKLKFFFDHKHLIFVFKKINSPTQFDDSVMMVFHYDSNEY